MRGVSNVLTTSALLLISIVLLVLILPWAWNAMTQVVDTLTRGSLTQTYTVLADVYFIPPPAENPNLATQIAFVFNSGEVDLTDVRVKMLDNNFNTYDLNIFVIRRDGGTSPKSQVVSLFRPGDVLVVEVPPMDSYLGFQFIFQSKEYSEVYEVGG